MSDRPEKEISYIDVKLLRFDPENPRLPENLQSSSNFKYTLEYENRVIDWMLRRGTIIELMGSIGENGYFEGEPMFVVESQDKGFYYVVEGNRRLAAVKLLQSPQLAKRQTSAIQNIVVNTRYTPERVMCLTYDDRRELVNFLGYRHITGIKQWGALQKARYLKQIRDMNPELSFAELAKLIGSNSNYVARLLTALALFEQIDRYDYFDIEGLNAESINFSFLPTALSYRNLVDHLGLDPETGHRDPELKGLEVLKLKWLTEVMFEKVDGKNTRLGESRYLKELNKIVTSSMAMKAFDSGLTISESLLRIDEPEALFRQSLQEARNQLTIAWGRVPLLSDVDESDLNLIRDVYKLARRIHPPNNAN